MPDAKNEQRNPYAALRRLTAASPEAGSGDVWTPAWSSKVLEETIEKIIRCPDGRLRDIFEALWRIAGEPDAPLTRVMANFIHDIVVLCFTRYRTQYDAEDFRWMAERMHPECTPPQAYLAALALPEPLVTESRNAILSNLKRTEFLDEVEKMLR